MLAQIDDEDEEFHAIGHSSTADASAQYSSLTLIDLAGSERQKNTKASANLEGGNGNKQEFVGLGDVIGKLSSEGSDNAHVPYRNSKLTRVLKHSLGGNSFTTVIIAMTPAPSNTVESISSLSLAKCVKK